MSLIVSIKFNEDRYRTLHYYAIKAGYDYSKIVKLEHMFLTILNYEIFVSDFQFNSYLSPIIKRYEKQKETNSTTSQHNHFNQS